VKYAPESARVETAGAGQTAGDPYRRDVHGKYRGREDIALLLMYEHVSIYQG